MIHTASFANSIECQGVFFNFCIIFVYLYLKWNPSPVFKKHNSLRGCSCWMHHSSKIILFFSLDICTKNCNFSLFPLLKKYIFHINSLSCLCTICPFCISRLWTNEVYSLNFFQGIAVIYQSVCILFSTSQYSFCFIYTKLWSSAFRKFVDCF